MTSVPNMDVDGTIALNNFSVQDQRERQNEEKGNHGALCSICLDKIVLQEIAFVKGCEHAYRVTCILRWATYSRNPTCPQCKNPFEFLHIHRSLDGSIHDYMFEESVCLLLRATWFKPLTVEDHKDVYDYPDVYDYLEDCCEYDDLDEVDDLDEAYFNNSSSIRIGNRRWGYNGYVSAGRQEARPVLRSNFQDSGSGSSQQPKKKDATKDSTGRRAKRALKREAAESSCSQNISYIWQGWVGNDSISLSTSTIKH